MIFTLHDCFSRLPKNTGRDVRQVIISHSFSKNLIKSASLCNDVLNLQRLIGGVTVFFSDCQSNWRVDMMIGCILIRFVFD